MMANRYFSVLAFLCLLLVACVAAGLGIYLLAQTEQDLQVSVPVFPATPTATSVLVRDSAPILTPTSEVASTPLPSHPTGVFTTTEYLLAHADVPVRDRIGLARRFKLSDQPIPAVVNPVPPSYQVGDQETFWIGESDTLRYFEVTATLRYVGPHSYWWIENGYDMSDADIAASAEVFESTIYPTDRAFFGSEWVPGVDNDPRLHVFIGNVPGVGGYFYSINEYSKLINPYSNEKEVLFVNVNAARPGTDQFNSTLAHEFQHMIHWHNDANEETWVNEGLAELAITLNGYGSDGAEQVFVQTPDTQLTAWGDSAGESIAHYGASFLFMSYFLERFGEATMRQVVANPANGADGFNAVLAAGGQPYRFDDVFADWVVTNYLEDPTAGQGLWGYRDLSVNSVALDALHQDYPVDQESTVSQYAADYIAFEGHGALTIEFTGTTQVKVAPNEAHSGAHEWWSNRGDDSDMTLTRTFDLSGVDQAQLQFWTWYDIEKDWDFAYVEVSTDGGQTWDILPGRHTTAENKSGNNFGQAWTGLSGGGDVPQWVPEEVDLSAYAGRVIEVRFEYITDDAVNHVGFLLDDIAIPAIGYFDDAEAGDGGWQAAGFVRIDNALSQRYIVQVIAQGDQLRVQRMALDATNHGQLTITDLGETVDRVVLVVGGITPFTTEVASYRYSATLTR